MQHPYFERLIFSMIGFSSILLAFDENYLDAYSKEILDIIQNITSVGFIAEFLLKSVVLNFAFVKKPFCGKHKR